MRYANLRWTDIARLDKDRVLVVCPLGSIEQHGHHLPLVTDTALVTAVAECVEQRLADRLLLAPTLWLGASDHHLDFAGTLSVPNSFYVTMIKNLVRSLVRAGFTRILLLNGHGGNIAPGEAAIAEMANECDKCDRAIVALASYWAVAAAAMEPHRHGMESPRLTHACEYETSMMLHLHRDLVVLESARGEASPEMPEAPGTLVAGRFPRRTSTGALGRPDLATPAKGASLLAAITDEVTSLAQQMLTWPQRGEKPLVKMP
jgi:creatinine amidohydrolase